MNKDLIFFIVIILSVSILYFHAGNEEYNDHMDKIQMHANMMDAEVNDVVEISDNYYRVYFKKRTGKSIVKTVDFNSEMFPRWEH